jgi:hypothetical protein
VSELTSGRGEIKVEQAFDRDGSRAGHKRFPIARWLLLAAALLWPLAVALSRLALRGAVTSRVQYAGASAGYYLRVARSRLPGLPGRARSSSSSDGASPSPLDADIDRLGSLPAPPGDGKRPSPTRPARPERPVPSAARKAEKAEAAAPAATLGSLLESQRRRRNGPDDEAADP